MNLEEKLLKKIETERIHGRSVLEQYRQVLIEMKKKHYTQHEMAELLSSEGIQVTQPAISQYLKKRPLSSAELRGAIKTITPRKDKNTLMEYKAKEKNTKNLDAWKEEKSTKEVDQKKVLFDLNKPF